tara:strand:+ start:51 stop:461 length:411 start_codon:yes stop_codon:yes gene_type:complete
MSREVLYIIFGGIPVEALNDCDMSDDEEFYEVVNKIDLDGSLVKFDSDDYDQPYSELLEMAQGWDDFAIIDKDLYDRLNFEVTMLEITEWNTCDLFNWLQQKGFIGEDEIFEDHMHDRCDMLDEVRENYFEVDLNN